MEKEHNYFAALPLQEIAESINAILSRECDASVLSKCTYPPGVPDHDYTDLSPTIDKLGYKLSAGKLTSFSEDFDDDNEQSSFNGNSNILGAMNLPGNNTNGDFTYISLSQKRKRSPRIYDLSDEENCPEEQLSQLHKKEKADFCGESTGDSIQIQDNSKGRPSTSEAIEKSKIFPAPCSELKYVALRSESLLNTTPESINESSEVVETSKTSFNNYNFLADLEKIDDNLDSSTLSSSTAIDSLRKSSENISTEDVSESINFEYLDDADLSAEIPEISADDVQRVLESHLSQKLMEIDEPQCETGTQSSSPKLVSKAASLHYLSPISNPPEEEQHLITSDEEIFGPSNLQRIRQDYEKTVGKPLTKADSIDDLPEFIVYDTDEPKGWDSDEDLDEDERAAALASRAAKNQQSNVTNHQSDRADQHLNAANHQSDVANQSPNRDQLPEFFIYPTDDSKGCNTSDDSNDIDRESIRDLSNIRQLDAAASTQDVANGYPSILTYRNTPSADTSTLSDDSDYQSLEDGRYFETATWRSPWRSNRWASYNRYRRRKNSYNPFRDYTFFGLPKSKNNAKKGEVTREEARLTVDTLHTFSNSLEMRPSRDVRLDDPKHLNVRLMPHQQHALAWMTWRENCTPSGGILADDMGLGKTLTITALIMKSLEAESHLQRHCICTNLGGTLIVCPANLILQWYHEINRRADAPSEVRNVNIYHHTKERKLNRLAEYAVVITSYDTLKSNFDSNKILFKMHWKRVILDEAHVIRNPNAKKSICLTSLVTDKRWVLTGTPIHNKTKDVFPLIRFLQVRPFNEQRSFTRWIDNKDIAGEQRLKFVMDTIMLRRTKTALIADNLMPDLPLKAKRVINITLAFEERSVYDKVMTFSQTLFMQFLHQRLERDRERSEGPAYRRNDNYYTVQLNRRQLKFLQRRGPIKHHHILTLILRLRQICCHPALIHKMLDEDDLHEAGVEKVDETMMKQANLLSGKSLLAEINDENEEIGVDENVIENETLSASNPVFDRTGSSSKMTAVLEKVREIVGNGEKVLIVSDWVGYLDIIGQHLETIPGATYCSYTGTTNYRDRDNIVTCFNTERNPMVLLLSLRAGGQGLNLMAANHVILVDIHWNPQLEVQAQDRVWRIGQIRDVFIHKLICLDTIEERIIDLQDKKLQIADNVLSGVGRDDKLGIDELRTLFNV